MRTRYKYLLALLGGTVAGGIVFLGTDPVVDRGQTWLVTGVNAFVWSLSIWLYLSVLGRLPAVDSSLDARMATVRWGGVAGGLASVGVCGTVVLILPEVPIRYGGAIALFVFGLVFGSMATGIAATWVRYERTSGDATT
jgi:hypothetical protein